MPAAVASAAITGASSTGRSRRRDQGQRRSISTSLARSLAIITPRRPNRSATTPPTGPRTTIGTTRAAVATPAHSADPVRW